MATIGKCPLAAAASSTVAHRVDHVGQKTGAPGAETADDARDVDQGDFPITIPTCLFSGGRSPRVWAPVS